MEVAWLRWLAALLVVLVALPVQAATCTSRQNGNWSQANRWNCGSGTSNGPPAAGDDVVINGHAITLNNDANVKSVTVNGASGVLAHSSATSYALTITNDLTVNGSVTNTGSGTFTITAGSVTNSGSLSADVLTVSGGLTSSGTVTLANLNVSGNVTNNSGTFTVTNLVFQGGTQDATFYGANTTLTNLTVNAGTSVTSSNYSVWTHTGNLVSTGNFNLPNATVTLSGTAVQTLGGTSTVTLGRLTLNKSSGGVTLAGNLDLATALTLTSGRITTGNYRVSLSVPCGSGLARSAGSWVIGNVQLSAPAYGATCTFPVGDAQNYAPIIVSYPYHDPPLGGALTGRTDTGDHPDTLSGISAVGAGRSVNRYWTLTPGTGSSFYNYSATLQYCVAAGTSDCSVVDVDFGATPASFVGARKTGGAWSALTPSAIGASSVTLPVSSGFGEFVVGEAGSSGLTCISDNFSGGLNATLWNVAGSGFTPQVVSSPTVPSSRLRLTDNASNRSTFAQIKRWFPAAGNMVVVEFDYFVYGGSGADGITMVLSDAGVPPSPGGYGGSLGYANRSGIDGFNGGWLGIGVDEYGNYPNPSEGRRGYPTGYVPPAGANVAAGFYANSIAIRGSGVGQTSGYALLANTGVVSPVLTTTNSVPHRYRITVDHSNNVNAFVKLERNTGSGYVTVVPTFDAKAANSGQAAVPANFLLSFTGSTGGSTNFHELGNVQVCATTIAPVGGSTRAANFECLETGTVTTWSATARHPLYTKITDANFRFDIAALKTDGSIENNFVAAGGDPKNVTVELFDDSAATSPACSAYASPVATQTVQYISGDGGRKTITSNFNLNRAWSKLRCRVTDASALPTVYGCSTDTFAVRPQTFSSVTSTSSADADGTGASASATPAIKAGASFSLTANTGKAGYSGTPKIDASKTEWTGVPTGGLASPGVGTVGGTFSTAASSATGNGASGSAFTYSEVGYFRFQAQGVYDDDFTSASGDLANSDCIKTPPNDFSNSLISGQYGCKFGNVAVTNHFGRFIPDHFALSTGAVSPACGSASKFTYFGQDGFSTPFTLTAQNSANGTTKNFVGNFARLGLATWGAAPASAASPGFGFSVSAATPLPAGSVFAASTTAPSGSWVAGEASITAKHQISRPTNLTGETPVIVMAQPVDADGVTLAAATAVQTASTPLRYGRARLQNGYGSELLDLPMVFRTEYWAGVAAGWVLNSADTCTDATLSFAQVGATNITGNTCVIEPGNVSGKGCAVAPAVVNRKYLESGVTGTDSNGVAGFAGNFNLWLKAPGSGNAGTIRVDATVPAWLQFNWTGAVGNPSARATFGVYRSGPIIHRREMY